MFDVKVQPQQILKLILFTCLGLMMGSYARIADATTPTSDIEVCITLQGSRDADEGEPLSWEMRQSGAVAFFGSATTVIQNPPSTVGCFQLTGIPNQDYDLYVIGDDSLGMEQ